MSSLEITLWFAVLLFTIQQVVAAIIHTNTPDGLDELLFYLEQLAPLSLALRYATFVPFLLAVYLADSQLSQMKNVEGWVVLGLVSISGPIVIILFGRLMRRIEVTKIEWRIRQENP